MVAGRDVLFAALRVERGELVLADGDARVVDDAGLGVVGDVVDVVLVERPGVEQTFGALLVAVVRRFVSIGPS